MSVAIAAYDLVRIFHRISESRERPALSDQNAPEGRREFLHPFRMF